MKKLLLFSLLILCMLSSNAQKDTSISIDQLQVPGVPAFNMLNISPNNIERPKNPTDFALALGNATSGFSTIPKDYAIEIAPFWVFGKKKATFKDFMDNVPGKNILQTATISIATTATTSRIDSSEFRQVALAIKFSIFRGNMGPEFKEWNDSVSTYLRQSSEIKGAVTAKLTVAFKDSMFDIQRKISSSTNEDEKKKWSDSLKTLVKNLDSLVDNISLDSIKKYKESYDALKVLVTRTDFRRYGFKMDFALGSVLDYPDSNFQRCYGSRVSAWLTSGWESPDFNLLGVLRFTENINNRFLNDSGKVVKDVNWGEIDYGVRVYKDFTDKLTLSAEYVRRISLYNADQFSKKDVMLPANSERFVVSVNYKIGKNQNLSFVYGRNFDNTYYKTGNLVAALNLLVGFGSSRPFKGN